MLPILPLHISVSKIGNVKLMYIIVFFCNTILFGSIIIKDINFILLFC